MARLNKNIFWQALAVVILLIIHLAEGNPAGSPPKKQKKPGNQKCKDPQQCKDCILVQIRNKENKVGDQLPGVLSVRNISNRSIVPWEYENLFDFDRIPRNLYIVTCSNYCKGFEKDLNAVPISRKILVLKRQKKFYTLESLTITVGCTCVHPEFIEENPEDSQKQSRDIG